MKITETNYTPIQLKLQVDYEKIIDITDPVYSFMEVMNHIDLNRYIVEKDYNMNQTAFFYYIVFFVLKSKIKYDKIKNVSIRY